MKRLDLTEIARADLASIRRYSTQTWGRDQTSTYMDDLRDTMKGLVRGTVGTRGRDDLKAGLQMATTVATSASPTLLAGTPESLSRNRPCVRVERRIPVATGVSGRPFVAAGPRAATCLGWVRAAGCEGGDGGGLATSQPRSVMSRRTLYVSAKSDALPRTLGRPRTTRWSSPRWAFASALTVSAVAARCL